MIGVLGDEETDPIGQARPYPHADHFPAEQPRSSDPAWPLPLSHLRVGFGNPAENAA